MENFNSAVEMVEAIEDVVLNSYDHPEILLTESKQPDFIVS